MSTKTIPVVSELGNADAIGKNKDLIKVYEIYYSIQGEANTVGWPTVFIRLTGCPLRCQYCDTEYAFTGGEWLNEQAILSKLKTYNTKYITVTGGEPLAQKNCFSLLTSLCDAKYNVSLETSGAISTKEVDKRVVKVLDIKTPASQEAEKNDYDNFNYLQAHDQIKFVICNKEDFDWAVNIVSQYNLTEKVAVLFSPSKDQLSATDLANWILEQQLNVRLQTQLHKALWGDRPSV